MPARDPHLAKLVRGYDSGTTEKVGRILNTKRRIRRFESEMRKMTEETMEQDQKARDLSVLASHLRVSR